MHQLTPQQLVSVSLPVAFSRGVDVVNFRVVAVIDYVVALDPVARDEVRSIPERVHNCYLAVAHEARLFGFKGHLYQRTPGDWRFKVKDRSFHPDSSFRIRICAPIGVAACENGGSDFQVETETVDIGADGALVDAGDGWDAPEHAILTLSLPGDDQAIETSARLVARHGGLAEFRYEGMEAAMRNRLGSFIIQYERDRMRRRQLSSRGEVCGLDDDLYL